MAEYCKHCKPHTTHESRDALIAHLESEHEFHISKGDKIARKT